MKRLTKNDLKAEIATRNEFLAFSGSNILFKHLDRNDYTAVDLCFIDDNGKNVCACNIAGATPNACIESVFREGQNYYGKIYHGTKLSRKMAKSRLLGHIDFNKDPDQLVQSELEFLHLWAKLTKYAKPVNFSRGYGFFIHLQKRVKL